MCLGGRRRRIGCGCRRCGGRILCPFLVDGGGWMWYKPIRMVVYVCILYYDLGTSWKWLMCV